MCSAVYLHFAPERQRKGQSWRQQMTNILEANWLVQTQARRWQQEWINEYKYNVPVIRRHIRLAFYCLFVCLFICFNQNMFCLTFFVCLFYFDVHLCALLHVH